MPPVDKKPPKLKRSKPKKKLYMGENPGEKDALPPGARRNIQPKPRNLPPTKGKPRNNLIRGKNQNT